MATSPYAIRAETHYRQHLPARYQALTDPDSFFTDLGEQISVLVAQRKQAILAQLPPAEGYLAQLAALNTAQTRAEDQVLRQMLPPAEEDTPAA
jgi:hypothetical protein